MAACAAAAAMRGSTTDARKETVDIMGLPDFENGIGWNAKGPATVKGKSRMNKFLLKIT